MNTEALARLAGPHMVQLFSHYPTDNLTYHNLTHTRQVVDRTLEIGRAEGITNEEQMILEVAAWFHDTGHLNGGNEGHEARSVEFMRSFMKDQPEVEEDFVQAVADCIMATMMPHNPQSLLDKIIEDADSYHFATADFRKTNKLVKKELELRGYVDATKNWRLHTLELLNGHQFKTDYCRKQLDNGKLENITWAQGRVLEKEREDKAKDSDKSKEKDKDKDNKKKSKETPEEKEAKLEVKQKNTLVARGLQTMLKLASENQVELSNLADGKANILISVNAIIISVILSMLIRRLEVDTYLTVPTILFLTSSVITIVVAILATRPKVSEGSFTREDITSKKTNLLFFGNFYKSTLEEYQWAMGQLMTDKEYIYGSLVKDIYFLGVVLGRKYKLIRLAYNVFMIGIVLSVIAFTLAVLLKNPQDNITVTNGTRPPL